MGTGADKPPGKAARSTSFTISRTRTCANGCAPVAREVSAVPVGGLCATGGTGLSMPRSRPRPPDALKPQ
jgi:hypothetical protein